MAGGVEVDVGVDAACGTENRGEEGVNLRDVTGLVGVEDVLCGLEAAPGAGPLFGTGVFGPAEEVEDVISEPGAGLLDHGEGFLFEEARQVEEV